MKVFVTQIVQFFETDNSERCMSCSCIGMGLVTYYISLVMILEGIGNGNGIWFCNYNRNHSGSRVFGYGFVLGLL